MFAPIVRNMSSLQAASVAFFIHTPLLSKNTKRKESRWWQTQLCSSRTVCSGARFLVDMKFKEISRKYKKFTHLAPAYFEFLINLIGMEIGK
jgi:hypothetical protein